MKNKNNLDKELEFGMKIDSPERIEAVLRSLPGVISRSTLLIRSEIYKKKGNRFFWRFSTVAGKKEVLLSFKEDLLALKPSLAEVMKEAAEVNLTLTQEQAAAIKRIIALLGYQPERVVKKKRLLYQLEKAQISLDFYYPEKQWYLEIESRDQREIEKLRRIITKT